MKIALVTDAWQPQVNGVVTTLVELVKELTLAGHSVKVIEPGQFATRPCPGYAGIDLAISPKRRAGREARCFRARTPSTWPPKARSAGPGARYCLKRKLAFTTAFHTKFPEIVNAAVKVPLSWGYALFRHFHRPSSGVMVPTHSVLRMLERRGFRNLRAWTHGVDTSAVRVPAAAADLHRHGPAAAAGRAVRRAGLVREEHRGLPEHGLSRQQGGLRRWPGRGAAQAAASRRCAGSACCRATELAKVYAAADLFVFPSQADTFGLVMVEAMATGTPVAAYPVDGPLEVLGRRDAQRPQPGRRHARRPATGLLRGARRAPSRSPGARAGFQLAACHRPVHQLPGRPRANIRAWTRRKPWRYPLPSSTP